MAWTRGTTVVAGALRLIGVLGQGSAPTASQLQEGMRRLNMMMGQWFTQSQTQPVLGRQVFPCVSNKQVYTVGPGGDLDMPRPLKLDGLGLLLNGNNGSIPPQQQSELPRLVFTTDQWQHIQIKALPNALFTGALYQPTFTGGFGTLTVWPIPNNNLHSIVLYQLDALPLFTTAVAQYDLPEGADEALEYNLAVRLAAPNTVPVPSDVAALARTSLANFKRSTAKWNDMPVDPMFAINRRTGYNINTGTGG